MKVLVLVLALIIFFGETTGRKPLSNAAKRKRNRKAKKALQQKAQLELAAKMGNEENKVGGNGSVEKSEPNNEVPEKEVNHHFCIILSDEKIALKVEDCVKEFEKFNKVIKLDTADHKIVSCYFQ